tara:strand:- start:2950 stop:3165 length:216 start_codon:yes stop_codon:yes gene_type:complete
LVVLAEVLALMCMSANKGEDASMWLSSVTGVSSYGSSRAMRIGHSHSVVVVVVVVVVAVAVAGTSSGRLVD